MSRRARYWAAGVWVALVIAGGGATVLLQEPHTAAGQRHPTPDDRPSPRHPTARWTDCPTSAPRPDGGGHALELACAVKVGD
ncbi:hypothetical protein [Streptomyces sp. NPDC053427]|uniref:hypothetical protein n=1 Tax=Streptomyces sp. NPDC053427 TaxID=3365701 RepID=UPI0037D38EE0